MIHDADAREWESFRVDWRQREPLVAFMEAALQSSGCSILNRSPNGVAPFRLSFVTPWGERMGILAYAFFANSRATRNRPADEWRFQIKYGSKDGHYHRLWQDPFQLYTTLLLGINPDGGFFVGADPILNDPTRFFISKEFKQTHVDLIATYGWHAWERDQRRGATEEPHEVLVGASAQHFLRYILFEREALGESQGDRQLLAEQFLSGTVSTGVRVWRGSAAEPTPKRLSALEREFDLSHEDILGLIEIAPRLKMAVRGWVAQHHLETALRRIPSVADVESIERDGQPDFRVLVRGARRPVLVECKNVLRLPDAAGHARLDFQRTRAAKSDPCSRYYSATDFDILAACLHARSQKWEFVARQTVDMAPHRTCAKKLSPNVILDSTWSRDLESVLKRAAI